MKTMRPNWHDQLPGVGKTLVEAGYLHACKPKGTSLTVDGFLDFDVEKILSGMEQSDIHAKVSAVAYSSLPWVDPASSELAARAVTDFEKMRGQEETATAVLLWLMKDWNRSRLAGATGWPEYEVGQHVVDLDVVLGHRRAAPSPFIGHGFTLSRPLSIDFLSLLHDIAGAVFRLEPSTGAFYGGPMVWADRQTGCTRSEIDIFLTPFDIMNHGHGEEFLEYLRDIPGLTVHQHDGRAFMSADAIPLFGVDEGDDWETVPLQFLTPMWWDNQVFASVSAPCFLEGGFSWRIPLDKDKTMLHSKRFGQFDTAHALFWFATPEEHAAMLGP